MTWSQRLRVALRYTFAHGEGHLSTFLSTLSMLGLVLATGLLIIVLSVMNGFDREMRERILALVPHISLYSYLPIEDPAAVIAALAAHPEVAEVAAFSEFDTLIIRGRVIETARGVGIDTTDAAIVERLLSTLAPAQRQAFLAAGDGLVLGSGLAEHLGASPGESLTLVVPGTEQGGGALPAQYETVRLAAVVHTGTELDQALALVHLPLASRLAGLEGAAGGFRISTRNLFESRRIAHELMQQLPPGYYSTHWLLTHGNLYAAIQLSRNLVSVLLLSIIAVAAFNVVSSLVLVVMDKQGNIAILRTLGASGSDIAWIFVLQGGMIGAVGVLLGSALGALGSVLVPDLVAALERLLQVRFLDTDVYPVSFLPVDLLASDVLTVAGVALLMCLTAAIYPARRAAGLAPAMVLNQDR